MMIVRLLILFPLALDLLACNSPSPAAPANTPTTPPTPLEGTHWVVVEVDGQPVPPSDGTNRQDATLHLDPEKKAATGSGSCNRFSGSYTRSGTDGLTFSPLAMTRRACPDMALEQAYSRALGQTASFRIDGPALTLRAAGSTNALARLEARPAPDKP